MFIACLHTAQGNVDAFEEAAWELDFPAGALCHMVRADLLVAAELAGGMSEAIAAEASTLLCGLAQDADVVLLTCSTLGAAAYRAQSNSVVPIIRVDEALARQAVSAGGDVVVLCTLEATIAPTAELFMRVADETGVRVEIRLVQDAWHLYRAGDVEAYLMLVADAAMHAYQHGATTVALAQASMSGAVKLMGDAGPNVLTSPRAALMAVQRLGFN